MANLEEFITRLCEFDERPIDFINTPLDDNEIRIRENATKQRYKKVLAIVNNLYIGEFTKLIPKITLSNYRGRMHILFGRLMTELSCSAYAHFISLYICVLSIKSLRNRGSKTINYTNYDYDEPEDRFRDEM